jgi:CubicO group peptidase (beta-lactamase class C family)
MLFRITLLLFFISTLLNSSAQDLDRKKVDSLVDAARKANSDGLVIMQNGKVVVEEYFGQPQTPTYIASVSKALVSMAIVKLLNDKKIRSIDQPVSDFYPEWKQGQKRSITLRMLLSHTSGMQNETNSRLEIETGPKGSGDDLVKLALAAEITDRPGTVFNYNNKATCLLPGIIEVASGKRMDKYFEEEFFAPMNITKFDWKRDGTGRPQGHGGFMLLPMDLAKFGQLMLSGGEYNGKRFFESRWVDSSIIPSQQINPSYGLIWNLMLDRNIEIVFDAGQLKKLTEAKVNDDVLAKLTTITDKVFHSEQEVAVELEKLFGSDWLSVFAEAAKNLRNGMRDMFRVRVIGQPVTRGYYHTGSWGNYLVIDPVNQLVAVRAVKRDKEYVEERDKMGGFVQVAFSLFNR